MSSYPQAFAFDTWETIGSVPGDYLRDSCIHELFEAQVERTPDSIAVIFEDSQLTYTELNHRANQLAHHLQSLGIGPEVLVALYLERSLDMVVGLLGILKAGGAYVPFDIVQPRERLISMIENARIPVLLSHERWIEQFSVDRTHVICLDRDWQIIAGANSENPAININADNLAYMIYTSGSTGKPKGVLVQHRSAMNYILIARDAYMLAPNDHILQFASISFDTSVEEVYPSLICGATLVLRNDSMIESGSTFVRACQRWALSVLNLPTAYWHELTARLGSEILAFPPSLRLMIIGGEQVLPTRLARWQQYVDGRIRLINTYGPTETTIAATMCDLSRLRETYTPAQKVPIGRAIPHVQAYILDECLQPAPVEVPGEVYIGGAGLARGYFHHPDLTAECFIPNPFGTMNDEGRTMKDVEASTSHSSFIVPRSSFGTRLYRTGDRAQRLPDGSIAFLGRLDHQVKIRGFRIELGEIEAALQRSALVRECAVVAHEDVHSEKRLVAYVVLETDDQGPSGSAATTSTGAILSSHASCSRELRRFLQEKLPAYMLPAAFVVLDSLPKTPGGKVDRRALPQPEHTWLDLEESVATPRTATEAVLAKIWGDVFGLDQIGIHDNFFDLGGHSLAAIRVLARVWDTLQVELPLKSLFSSPTVAELSKVIEQGRPAAYTSQLSPIRRIPRAGPLPLSFSQERVLFLNQLAPENIAYHAYVTIFFKGNLNIATLERTLSEIVRRHEILRTSFCYSDAEHSTQIIHPPFDVGLLILDLQGVPPDRREGEVKRLIFEECQRPFDVSCIPLVRWTVLRLDATEHILVQVEHHLLHDGWSLARLLYEIKVIYTSFSAGRSSPLPEPVIQYADFAAWQRQWMQEKAGNQLAYWKQKLAGSPPLLALPADRRRPAVQTFRGWMRRVELPVELCQALRGLSRREGVTLFMTMLAAFQALLYRYTHQEDILVGSAVANRRFYETEALLGMIVNNVVLRTTFSNNPTFRELLAQVREITLEAYANQDLPFEKVVEALHPERDLSYNPLFQVMFSFHDAAIPSMELPGLNGRIIYPHNGSAKFDLNVVVMPHTGQYIGPNSEAGDDSIVMEWEYSTDLFDDPTITRMIGHYQTLLMGIVADPEQHIAHLSILTAMECEQQLKLWNNTAAEYLHDSCLQQIFEARAAHTLDVVAVVWEDQQLTYGELDRRANQLAHRLRSFDVGPEVCVGVLIERSPALIIGLLGVLKAGAAYVPLDPIYPKQRLAFMLADAQVRVLLTQQRLLDQLPSHTAAVIDLDADCDVLAEEPVHLPPGRVTSGNLAYVIYTSGSTGQPKGVQIQHRSIMNFLTSMQRMLGLNDQDTFLAVTTVAFDIAALELFLPLAVGARVVVAGSTSVVDGADLAAALARNGVSVMQATPATWRMLVEAGWMGTPRLSVLCGGEALSRDLADQLLERGESLWNLYGPTETTIWSSAIRVQGRGSAVSIGRPIANTQMYLLDTHLEPVPVGVTGDLYIGGDGVARGYLRRPDLTATQFLPNPFSVEPGARLYKTGDQAACHPDGTIELRGRKDQQVKVRGFRLELEEVEAVLATYEKVRDCAVVAHELAPGDKRLVAYVVPMREQGTGDREQEGIARDIASLSPVTSHLSPQELRTFLKEKLPEYMVPSTFVLLEAMPLTPNAKIDRHALPKPDMSSSVATEDFVAPRTPTEEVLARIWAEVLRLEQVGVYNDFFSLGGHSLLAGQVISRVRQVFQVTLPLRSLFEARTIAAFANVIVEVMLSEIDELAEDKV